MLTFSFCRQLAETWGIYSKVYSYTASNLYNIEEQMKNPGVTTLCAVRPVCEITQNLQYKLYLKNKTTRPHSMW